MTRPEKYVFEGFVLDVSERRLSSAGQQAITLAPKAYDLLVTLVRQAGRLVTKRDLLQQVWPECFVEEGILTVHVSGLRKAFGDTERPPRYIETVQRSGYRFIAPVSKMDADGHAFSRPWFEKPVVRPRRPEVSEQIGLGRTQVLSASRLELPEAEAAFRAAVALDPTCAAAHAGIALVHCAKAALHATAPADAYARAKGAALRALALDDSCADALVALGSVMFLSEWDWVGAERSLQRALVLNPTDGVAHLLYGRLLETLGRLREGLEMKQRALARDPFSPLVHLEIAMSYFNQRDYDATAQWASKTLQLDPRHLLARELLAGASLANGDGRLRHQDVSKPRASLLGHAESYDSGVLDRALRRARARQLDVPDLQLAVLYSAAGDADSAFRHLNRAIDTRDSGVLRLAVAPQWDNLRADRRFNQCLARMGLSDKH